MHAIGNTLNVLGKLVTRMQERQLNTVHFSNSWTAAQVITLVSASVRAMAQAMENQE